MAKTIVIVGYGPGVSKAVAERFGAEGFQVAAVARDGARLERGVAALRDSGISAIAVCADATSQAALQEAFARARAELGPTTVLLWNAFSRAEAGDLLASTLEEVRATFDLGVVGLLAAVREALPDLSAAGDGAVLVTNGVLGEAAPQMDELAAKLGVPGVALANAAKAKLVGLLAHRLKDDGVYVGEVTITQPVKTTSGDPAGVDSREIAQAFWSLLTQRAQTRVKVP